MAKTTLLLLMTGILVAQEARASLDLTGWTPTCSGFSSDSLSIKLPRIDNFDDYYAVVIDPSNCSSNAISSLQTVDQDVPYNCINRRTNSVTLSLQHSNGTNKDIIGGKEFQEVRVSCHLLPDSGHLANASVDIGVSDVSATPTSFTFEPTLSPLNLTLVTSWNGQNMDSAAPTTSVTLGQTNVYLRIYGNNDPLLVPRKCWGTSHSAPGKTYSFFSADEYACSYDGEILEPFTLDGTKLSYARFYPFKFVSDNQVNLTCEVLICPESPASNSVCDKIKINVETNCSPGAVPQHNRRRRSASGQEPNTRVLEVTYSVINPDPALQGHTAAGSCVTISVPFLLASVAFLRIL